MKKHGWLAIGLSIFLAVTSAPVWAMPVAADTGTEQVVSSSSADNITAEQAALSLSVADTASDKDALRSSQASVSETCTITFDANGGTYYKSENAPSTWKRQYAKGSTWNDGYATAWREGYLFRGWSTDKNASDPIWTYSNYNSMTINSDVTLYAVWKEGFSITFDGNGGKSSSSDNASTKWIQEVVKGSKIGYTSAWRAGYVLSGWSTDPNATKPEWTVNEFSSVIPSSDMTVYAVWAEACKITFDGNGGRFNLDNTPSVWEKQVIKGSSPDYYLTPTREGCIFKGWSTDKNASEPTWTYDNYKSMTINSDITLYAVWTEGYEITFDGNGGKLNDSDGAPIRWMQRVSKESEVGYTEAYRKGYSLRGWSTDPNATEPKWTVDEFSSMVPNSNMTVYAVWAEGYTITFDGNGGKQYQGDDAPSRWIKQVVKGSSLDYFATPWREGYIFKGWSADKNALEPTWTYDNYKSMSVNSDMTLYAVWSAGYRVTFDANGGKMNNSEDAPSIWGEEFDKGEKLGVTDAYREGYTLKGWSTNPNATEPEWTVAQISSMTFDSDLTVYAVWAKETDAESNVTYLTHVQTYGESQGWVLGDQMSGTQGESKRMEALYLKLVSPDYSGSVEYRTHVQSYGWEKVWSKDGQMSGTKGEAKRLEAIQIRLTGEMAKHYDIYYCVHAQRYGWLNWAKNGEEAGTSGLSYRLEAIKIRLVKKGADAPAKLGGNDAAFYQYNPSTVTYKTHVQTYGESQGWVKNGDMSGTSGQSKRMEGIYIKLDKEGYSGGIQYRTHVQTYGWEKAWKENGQMSGTKGESKRLEAIQIQLTGDMAKYCDVYYCVHAQNYGWLGWAKNGESAGTAGYSYRLEAIKIVIVPKGHGAPASVGNTTRAFYQKS